MSSVEAALPTGPVTFLFTDIEGSTRLLRELGVVEYAAALQEHRRVVRDSVAAHGGVEVDTEGDAFFCVFEAPGAAAGAAAAAQHALADGPIRVRMGLHTGTAHLTEEGYVGEDVHLAARISAVGHGGQVVVSKATREHLGGGTLAVADLGEHLLKDFPEPVWLFQLGEERFPPLRTRSNTNLPRPVSSFVGREREVDEITALLRDGGRLVTLSGPGGSGKTRLAVEAAAALVPEFGNGVFWVGLAPLRDPALVLNAIAETLGAEDDLAGFMATRELLLLIDNFEQVVDAAPDLRRLLETAPDVRVLVTSRELLRVDGEVAYPVDPLDDPDAVELFCRRARVDPDETVEVLCRRLDNLPLALELAASRVSVLSPAQIVERLATRLDLLHAGRGTEVRQQTLRATIEWSHDLLEDRERVLFARLAVFRGGCGLEAAETVAGATLDGLQSLVAKSLVRHTAERFWMLETIREYARERLDDSGESDQLRREHAMCLLELARSVEDRLAGAEQVQFLARVDAEIDNIRAALDWAFAQGEVALAGELAARLERYWWLRRKAEGLAWLERALAERELTPELRLSLLGAAGGVAYFTGDVERAIELFHEAVDLARALGDRQLTARMLARSAPPLFVAGRFDEGALLVGEAVGINREIGFASGLVESLHICSGAAYHQGDKHRAIELLEESLAIAREIDDRAWIGFDLASIADARLELGEPARAVPLALESLEIARAIGDDLQSLVCLGTLAGCMAKRGDMRRAGLLWGAGNRIASELGDSPFILDRRRLEEYLGERGPEFENAVAEGLLLSPDEAARIAAG
jgi:predicted ATPase/class 3 adenylate cyclase